jgi:ribosomal protein S10
MVGKTVEDLEDISSQLKEQRRQREVYTAEPVRLPIKKLRVCKRLTPSHHALLMFKIQFDIRKAPCGQGKKTWSHCEMCIYKRLIGYYTDDKTLQEIVKSCLVHPVLWYTSLCCVDARNTSNAGRDEIT